MYTSRHQAGKYHHLKEDIGATKSGKLYFWGQEEEEGEEEEREGEEEGEGEEEEEEKKKKEKKRKERKKEREKKKFVSFSKAFNPFSATRTAPSLKPIQQSPKFEIF